MHQSSRALLPAQTHSGTVAEVGKTRKAAYIMYLYRECVEESYCFLYHYFTS